LAYHKRCEVMLQAGVTFVYGVMLITSIVARECASYIHCGCEGKTQENIEHKGGKSGIVEHWFSLNVNCFVKCICTQPGRISGVLDSVHCSSILNNRKHNIPETVFVSRTL
jgi:hypothetical protein